ncbi:MAG: RNA polymerase sigma factor [Actinomycetales bacterium]|nr:RNA polymerase sigma factor [Actinomycetales bacterium]
MVTPEPGEARDDTSLLTAASRGNQAAFATLFDRHVRSVFYQAFSVVHDRDQAQDIVQDTFYTLWHKREQVRLVDESVLPWLMVTARNLALNAHRKSRRGAALSLVEDLAADSSAEPASAAEAAFVSERIAESVSGLSELDRALFSSCIDGDLSYDQAAQNLGVSHGTVRNRLSRLKQRLRGDLAEATEES